MFFGEKLMKSRKNDPEFSLCCGNGKVSLKLPDLRLPEKLVEYLSANTKEAKYFRKHIRKLNAAFSFTSLGCNQIRFHGAPGSFKVQGQIYHNIGTHFGAKNPDDKLYKPKFASIYFFDTNNELDNRMDFGYYPDTRLGRKVVSNLQKIMHELNPFCKLFKTAIERSINENIPDLEIILKADMTPSKAHKGISEIYPINFIYNLYIVSVYIPIDCLL